MQWELYHLKHQPGHNFCLLPDIFWQECASWVFLGQMHHDGSRLKHRKIILIMVNCKPTVVSEVTMPTSECICTSCCMKKLLVGL